MDTILLHPAYLPSIEHMAAIAQAQQVIYEIEDNYQKQTYRNRAHIAHSNGKLLLNIPIKHDKNGNRQKTKEVKIENDFPWQEQHWKTLQSAYRTSPFFEYYEDELQPFFSESAEGLMDLNLGISEVLLELIGIETPVSFTSSYEKEPHILDLRFLINAKRKSKFQADEYIQVHASNHPFLPNLSILDLLFNEGPNTLSYLEEASLNF